MRTSLFSFILLSISIQPYLISASGSGDVDPVIAILTAQVEHTVPADTIPPSLSQNNNSTSDDTQQTALLQDKVAALQAQDAVTPQDTSATDSDETDVSPQVTTATDSDESEQKSNVSETSADVTSPPPDKRRFNKRNHYTEDDDEDSPPEDHDQDHNEDDSNHSDNMPDGGVEEAELGADEESKGDLFRRDEAPRHGKVSRAEAFNSDQRNSLVSDQQAKARQKRRDTHGKFGHYHLRHRARSILEANNDKTMMGTKRSESESSKKKDKKRHKPSPSASNSNSYAPTTTPSKSVSSGSAVSTTSASPTVASDSGTPSPSPALVTIAGAFDSHGNPIVITAGAPTPTPQASYSTGTHGGTPAGVSWLCQTQYNPTLKGCTGTPVYNKRDADDNTNGVDTTSDPMNCGSIGNVCYPEVQASQTGNVTCSQSACKLHCNRHMRYSKSKKTCVLKPAWASRVSASTLYASASVSGGGGGSTTTFNSAATITGSTASAASATTTSSSSPSWSNYILIPSMSMSNSDASDGASTTASSDSGSPTPVVGSPSASSASPSVTLSTIAGAENGSGDPVVITVGAAPLPTYSSIPSSGGSSGGGTKAGLSWLCQTQYNPTLKGCTGTPVYNRAAKRSSTTPENFHIEYEPEQFKMKRQVRRT